MDVSQKCSSMARSVSRAHSAKRFKIVGVSSVPWRMRCRWLKSGLKIRSRAAPRGSRRRHRHQRRHHSDCIETTDCTRRVVYRAHTSTTARPSRRFGAPAVRKRTSLSRGSFCSASSTSPHHPASRRRPDRPRPARTLPTQRSSRSRRRGLRAATHTVAGFMGASTKQGRMDVGSTRPCLDC